MPLTLFSFRHFTLSLFEAMHGAVTMQQFFQKAFIGER